MAYPLSENTVLVILQLSCNLLRALFIQLFQAVKNVGIGSGIEDMSGLGDEVGGSSSGGDVSNGNDVYEDGGDCGGLQWGGGRWMGYIEGFHQWGG
mmetsp:Transcript_29017/g.58139  ORF Transcript_29017/g.58139 Transcript_29017/m.58139 type:complete len:96 (+) Transcript_29017:284-571(+)